MVDVTIRGAGIFGLSVAWALVQRGAQVAVVDPGGPGAGASGGLVGALAPHVPENWNDKKAFQLDALLMAPAFWAGVGAAAGCDPGYRRNGRLQPIADERLLGLARERAEGATRLWRGQAEWRVISAGELPDRNWAPPSPTGHWVFDTLSAQLSPAGACATLVAALAARGAAILPDAPDRGLILHATGWRGLEDLSNALGRPVGNGVKGQAALLAHDAGDLPQLFADGIHFVPHGKAGTAIGSTSERDFADPKGCDERLEAVLDRARQLVPVLAAAPVIRRWAGVRPRAQSRAPLLGAWPGRDGHFVANGGFKIGFGVAPKVADVMADLMLDGVDNIPDGFRLTA